MKRKALFVAALVGLGSFANAQTTQMTNDKGSVITPETGDWAIGFDANPLFNYVGNAFNGASGNSLNTAFINGNQAIYGKMFKDENTAYRASLRLMMGSSKVGNNIDTNTLGNSAPEYVSNTAKYSGGAIVIGAGIEKRRGHNRLQGYYGGEVLITFGGTTPKKAYTYAVALDSTTVSNSGIAGSTASPNGDANLETFASSGRVLTSKSGATFGFGVRGFIGVEYFFAPKISVAAEYGWGLKFTSTGAGETVTENWGVVGTATSESLFETTTEIAKSSTFGIDTDNIGGAIRLMFHF